MHYAVSHGNFSIVSLLLDTKVCDSGKPNRAGYTPIMLVCLAPIATEEHKLVVKRLFNDVDINARACQVCPLFPIPRKLTLTFYPSYLVYPYSFFDRNFVVTVK